MAAAVTRAARRARGFLGDGGVALFRFQTASSSVAVRLSSAAAALPSSVVEAHERACAAGERTYLDPVSGLTVFTAFAHAERGVCCGAMCRHCSYGHENVGKRGADRVDRRAKATATAGRSRRARPQEAAGDPPRSARRRTTTCCCRRTLRRGACAGGTALNAQCRVKSRLT